MKQKLDNNNNNNNCIIKQSSAIRHKRKQQTGENIESSSSFAHSIPVTIRDEINEVVKLTTKTDREQSLTFCKLKNNNKVFVSNYSIGNLNETDVKPCGLMHGDAVKIGDLHTHPTQDPTTIGITPSSSDMVSTVLDSKDIGIPQISCITGPDAKMIHCYQPRDKILKDNEKIKEYQKAARYQEYGVNDFPPSIREHVITDFHHAMFERGGHYSRIRNPSAKDIVHDAFLKSKKYLKFKDVPNLQKGSFCDLIEDLNYPDKDKVSIECRKALKVREFLGLEF